MDTLTEPRITRIKHLKGYYLNDDYILDFEKKWNEARISVIAGIEKYDRLYYLSENFIWYVDCAMEKKNMTLIRIMRMRTTQMIAEIHARELGLDFSKPIPEPKKPKKFTIWKESK